MKEIDGSFGEGGGQILRSSLALSLLTGEPIRMKRIRANRGKPGLLRQHLTAVNAAAAISGAQVSGAKLGSSAIELAPGEVRAREYRFDIGTAGSATLVLQTVLLPLMKAGGPSKLVITGGTCNSNAPPYEFLARTFLPVLRRMGARVELELVRHGFNPAGGGELAVTVEPSELRPLELIELDRERRVTAKILSARLPRKIAERELEVLRDRLDLDGSEIEEAERTGGPGNAVFVAVEGASLTEVFTGFGARGVPGWKVAGAAAEEAARYLESGVPVGAHLADQLLLPMALAGKGRFRTGEPTLHTETNIEIVKRFLPVRIDVAREEGGVEISVR